MERPDTYYQRNRIIRYVFGAVATLALAVTSGGPLAYILPVLSLPFLAADKAPSIKEGLYLVMVIGISVLAANLIVIMFLDYPLVLLLVLFLVLYHIFYAQHRLVSNMVKVWLLIAVIMIPTIAVRSDAIALGISTTLVTIAFESIICIWVAYYLFPASPAKQNAIEAPKAAKSVQERHTEALVRTSVIFPVLLMFYFFELTSSLLVLVFVAILSMQAGFGQGFKAGKPLVIGNLMGGILAVLAYNTLTVVPNYLFFLLLSCLIGLLMAQKLYGGSKLAPLFGMAFSTYLLIIGSTTAMGEAEAGAKVWTRVLQIMGAVVYVAVVFRYVDRIREFRLTSHAQE